MGRKGTKNGVWRPDFIAARASGKSITASCAAAGITRKAAYDAKVADLDFAQAWLDAEEAAKDLLRDEVFRRATQGMVVNESWDTDAHGNRTLVSQSKRFSDTVLIFATKQADPSYREHYQVDVAGRVDHAHAVSLLDGRQPAEVDAGSRRAAARALLGIGDVIEGREISSDVLE